MTPTERDDLRRLAGSATAGPWDWLEDGRAHVKLVHVETPANHPVAAGLPICSIPSKRTADAAFIAAANPQTVLALLDEIDALEALSRAAPSGSDMVLVPVEPTDAMIEAGKDSLFEHARFVAIDRDPLFCWRAMVHAAASPAQAKEGKDAAKRICPYCKGSGQEADYVGPEMRPVASTCSHCNGEGFDPDFPTLTNKETHRG